MKTNFSVYNQDLAVQMDGLTRIIESNPMLDAVLQKAVELEIEHYYVGAGCIAQSVWNHLLGLPLQHGINDVDFVYYDADVSYDKECEVIHNVREQFGDMDMPVRLDIKNQARVHLWYEQHFGYTIQPYNSLEEAINTWPTTATALGVRRTEGGAWKVYAPFGLNDLFGLIVRANKVQITQEIYNNKVQRWRANWPGLRVIPWESN
ncbi:nucleotidyltransferase family protein [Paenibacillus sp. TY11]|uniref:nucleotidyltransferase family protein n=1 Tax=Paenibacillus sp. TY11 TaxID=3448633 RepID=UPI00403A60D0